MNQSTESVIGTVRLLSRGRTGLIQNQSFISHMSSYAAWHAPNMSSVCLATSSSIVFLCFGCSSLQTSSPSGWKPKTSARGASKASRASAIPGLCLTQETSFHMTNHHQLQQDSKHISLGFELLRPWRQCEATAPVGSRSGQWRDFWGSLLKGTVMSFYWGMTVYNYKPILGGQPLPNLRISLAPDIKSYPSPGAPGAPRPSPDAAPNSPRPAATPLGCHPRWSNGSMSQMSPWNQPSVGIRWNRVSY